MNYELIFWVFLGITAGYGIFRGFADAIWLFSENDLPDFDHELDFIPKSLKKII